MLSETGIGVGLPAVIESNGGISIPAKAAPEVAVAVELEDVDVEEVAGAGKDEDAEEFAATVDVDVVVVVVAPREKRRLAWLLVRAEGGEFALEEVAVVRVVEVVLVEFTLPRFIPSSRPV